jgi:hypothetical protein
MIRIEGRRSRIMLRRIAELAISAVIMVTVTALAIYVWHWRPGVTIGAVIAFPLAAHSIGGLMGAALRVGTHDPPVISWDQDGLTYLSGNMDDDVQLPWAALEGYRSTWEYPPRLKIRRLEGRPFVIDLLAFSDDDRARFVTELERRSRTLPTQRF